MAHWSEAITKKRQGRVHAALPCRRRDQEEAWDMHIQCLHHMPPGRKNAKGFTLLEVIIIVGVLGILASMMAPFAGYMDKSRRIKMTAGKIKSLAGAIAGPPDAYDGQGARVVGGYAGDMGGLPKLYKSVWDNDKKTWLWVEGEPEVVNGGGQPRGLWLKGPSPGAGGLAGDAPDYTDWKGPYLSYPADPYPDDTRHLQWSPGGDNEKFEQRQVEGKLSDAWGRVLYFIKEGAGDGAGMIIVSAGPDGKIALPDGPDPLYDERAPENKDNIALRIPHTWWRTPGNEKNVEKTRKVIEDIQKALIGPHDAFDPSGRRIAGGYTGDTGQWPVLWRWDSAGGRWEVSGDNEGQPRGLWIAGEGEFPGSSAPGFSWRGPYLPRPWGEGENEVLRDAWGTPMLLKLADDGRTLTIKSAGPDKKMAAGDDNIEAGLSIDRWYLTGMTVRGTVINNNAAEPAEVTVRLYHRPGDADGLSCALTVPAGGRRAFELSGDICAGSRRFKVEVAGGGMAGPCPSEIFIGSGGTQSPLEEKLLLLVE